MEYKELIAAFATKCGIEGLSASDGAATIEADGVRVELLDDWQTGCVLACADIGHPPPDADGTFGAMMLQTNFMLRGTEGATLCQNPETGAYALVRPFPLPLTDADSLAAGVESLVNQAENWRNALAGVLEAEKARAKALETDASHHDMIANDFLHV